MTALGTRFALNLAQVAFLLIFAPLVEGVLHRLEEIIQGKRGPSIWQTYRDIWKLFGKDEVISEESTWVFRFAPIIAFVMPMFVVLLIPALTAYPLFFCLHGGYGRGGLSDGCFRVFCRAGGHGHGQCLRCGGRQPHPHGRFFGRTGVHHGVF